LAAMASLGREEGITPEEKRVRKRHLFAGAAIGTALGGPVGGVLGMGAAVGASLARGDSGTSSPASESDLESTSPRTPQDLRMTPQEKAAAGGIGIVAALLAGPPGVVLALGAGTVGYLGPSKAKELQEEWLAEAKKRVDAADASGPHSGVEAAVRAGLGLCDEERRFLERRDARTAPALQRFLGRALPQTGASGRASKDLSSSRPEQSPLPVVRVALAGSGGGFRGMVSFAAMLDVAEECGLLDCTTYVAGLSGSTWTLGQWYSLAVHSHRKQQESCDSSDRKRATASDCVSQPARQEDISVRSLMPRLRERIQADLRIPPVSWLKAGSKDANYQWFAQWLMVRRIRGHAICMTDYWAALLTHHFLQETRDVTLSDHACVCSQGEMPLPVYTAVSRRLADGVRERVKSAERNTCSICGADVGIRQMRRKHCCKACGAIVCAECSPNKAALTLAKDAKPVRICDGCWGNGLFERVAAVAGTTSWNFWELTPYAVRELQSRCAMSPVDEEACCVAGTACPSWAFGWSFDDGRASYGGAEDSVGRVMGVCGSANCATLDNVAQEGIIPDKVSDKVMPVLRKLLKRPVGDDHICEPFEYNDHRAGLDGLPKTSEGPSVRLCDAGVTFNFPLPPLLQPERAVDVIIVFDCSDYKPGAGPNTRDEWGKCAEYCERHGLPLPAVDPARFQHDPVSVFRGDASRAEPTLIVFHLFKLPSDPEDTFDPLTSAATNGFCNTMCAKYTGEQFDLLASFNRQRLLSCLGDIREVLADRLGGKSS